MDGLSFEQCFLSDITVSHHGRIKQAGTEYGKNKGNCVFGVNHLRY